MNDKDKIYRNEFDSLLANPPTTKEGKKRLEDLKYYFRNSDDVANEIKKNRSEAVAEMQRQNEMLNNPNNEYKRPSIMNPNLGDLGTTVASNIAIGRVKNPNGRGGKRTKKRKTKKSKKTKLSLSKRRKTHRRK